MNSISFAFAQRGRARGAFLGILLLLGTGTAAAGPVNINTADASTLSRELKGVGEKRAQAIVDYRKAHGPFKSADELALVKGIGPSAIEKNRTYIRVDGQNTGQNTGQSAGPNAKCGSGPCGTTVKSNTMGK